jgi:aryl-alcohol dehydrogenase-like predicted oxidoreductase
MWDLFADAGGDVIDTADVYTNGTSETILGELLEGRRDALVILQRLADGVGRTVYAPMAPGASESSGERASVLDER